jgi:biotin carboxyl carrier protein
VRFELVLPQVVDDVLEPATVCNLLHGAGAPVRKGEAVIELINRDGMYDIPAPVTGLIVEIFVKPGQMVFPGMRLLVMESGGDG